MRHGFVGSAIAANLLLVKRAVLDAVVVQMFDGLKGKVEEEEPVQRVGEREGPLVV